MNALMLSMAALFGVLQAEPPSPAVGQLRHIVGKWQVNTDFLAPDGSIRGTLPGIYEFRWVTPDRIVQGTSELKDLGSSGILFYIQDGDKEIEMVSVGRDGRLWRMAGPSNSETRTTPNVTMPDGSTLMLRFTRYNVSPDKFESRMELSTDGGKKWVPGNHQLFRRCPPASCAD